MEETQRVLEHNVSTIDGQGRNLGSTDDLVGHDVLSVKRIQDEVRIELLAIVREDVEFEILRQFPQPIEKGFDAGGTFKMKQFIAVGSGSTHQVGDVDPVSCMVSTSQ